MSEDKPEIEYAPEEEKFSRRNFMSVATWTIGGIIGIGMIIPGIIYIVGPALSKQKEQEWIRLGPVSKVELGIPTLFKFKIKRQSGWIVNEEEISLYVYTEEGRDFIALSNICTHLGCRVRWIMDQDEFFCPCHNATFNKKGEVLSGPPPRPLNRYEVKVENDQLYVLGG